MGEIIEIINTVGFPIGCFILMYMESKNQREENSKLTNYVIDTLNNNTKALQELTDIVRGE